MIRRVGLNFLGVALVLCSVSLAQSAPSAAPSGELAEAAKEPTPVRPTLVVRVHSDTSLLSEEEIQQAIAAELGATLVKPAELEPTPDANVVVSFDRKAAELAVTYSDRKRGSWTRVVAAPAALRDVASTAALLVGSMARHEADELVAANGPQSTEAKVNSPSAPEPTPSPPEPTPSPPTRGSPEAPAKSQAVAPSRIANASFFFPLATNADAPNVKTRLSLNLLYGRIGALDGFELGSVNLVSDEMRGLELGVLANVVGGSAEGAQLAGLLNSAEQLRGLSVAGALNALRGSLQGGQAAFGANFAGGEAQGLQLAVGLNYAGSLDGLQLAGLSNLSAATLRGAQVAFVLNRAGDVVGGQVALVNIAARVRGVQLGLINISDDVDGVPIGLLSVSRSGGVHPMAWFASDAAANFAVKFATRYTYSFINVSLQPGADSRRARFGPGFAIGASIPAVHRLFVETDIGGTHLFADSGCCEDWFFGAAAREHDETQFKLRALLRYQFLPRLSLFAGAGLTTELRYPLDAYGDTKVKARSLMSGFAGVQL